MLRAIGKFIWRFMIIFSFIVNIVLVIVLLALGILIFDIKNNIASPLVQGLHSSFVGLDDATIDWTIPVRDRIPVKLNIPLKTDTTVVLTKPVPITVNAQIDLPGINAYGVAAKVNLELPQGLSLPVALDLNVPVDQQLDVALDVRAVIPLKETQLHDVADNLRLLFEPLARALDNLPNNFGEAGQMVSNVLAGKGPNLLDCNAYCQQPWPGFSKTAGLNYTLYNQPVPPQNVPVKTGIVPLGGIPFLDQQIRPEVYQEGGPQAVNAQAASNLQAQSVPADYYNGGVGNTIGEQQSQAATQSVQGSQDTGIGGPNGTTNVGSDMGIIPTPTDGG
jgi:hypothetical protein